MVGTYSSLPHKQRPFFGSLSVENQATLAMLAFAATAVVIGGGTSLADNYVDHQRAIQTATTTPITKIQTQTVSKPGLLTFTGLEKPIAVTLEDYGTTDGKQNYICRIALYDNGTAQVKLPTAPCKTVGPAAAPVVPRR